MGISSSSSVKDPKEPRAKSARPALSSKFTNNKINTMNNEEYDDEENEITETKKPKKTAKTKKMVLNDKTIERFIDLQTKLETFERNGVFEDLRIAEEEAEVIKKEKKQLEVNYKKLNEKIKQMKTEFSASKGVFLYKKEPKNKPISNEQREYLQNLSILEKISIDLKIVTEQYNISKAKLDNFRRNNYQAISLYNEQMEILHLTFEGEYGSELEFKLENEVKNLTEQKDQLKSALIKWGYARYLLVYSYDQLRTGEQQWIELMNLELTKTDTIIYATEVKNNLIAAYQNLVNAKTYLKNVDMPHCTDDDLNHLQNLANEIYEYMSDEGQSYFHREIQMMRKKSAQLNEWFEQVVKMFVPLVSEYAKVKSEFEQKSELLKRERIRLLQQKLKEAGKNINMNMIDLVSDGKEKTNLSLIMSPLKSKLILVNEASTVEKIPETKEDIKPIESEPTFTESIEALKSESPNNLSFEKLNLQLPTPLTRDQLLDNLEDIKQQYRENEKEWNVLLNNSKKEADEKLKKFLDQYK